MTRGAAQALTAEELRTLSDAATPGPWRARQGYGPDGFEPDGYKFVQFGPTEKKANGYGTDQLKPADAELIAAAVNHVRATLDATRAAVRQEPAIDELRRLLNEALEFVPVPERPYGEPSRQDQHRRRIEWVAEARAVLEDSNRG